MMTNPATLIASFSATLNGSLNPHGLTTTVYFQYGTTTGYGLTTAPQSKSGNSYQNVTANISSLTATTTYHFRVIASNADGMRTGSDRTFTTLTATGAPVVITNPATNVTSSSATLHGVVDPHGLNTSVWWQWGLTPNYGSMTDPLLKSGNTWQNEIITLPNLRINQTYHYRIVATNAHGTVHSLDKTFTTQR
jgi:hypothetical protein